MHIHVHTNINAFHTFNLLEESNFNFRYVFQIFPKKAKLFTNSADPDKMPRAATSEMGLQCLLITLLRVSRWVKVKTVNKMEHL